MQRLCENSATVLEYSTGGLESDKRARENQAVNWWGGCTAS